MRSIIIQAVLFTLLSSSLIASGLRVLTAKRPFIVSERWGAIMTVLGFMPLMAFVTEMLWPKYPWESWLMAFLPVVFYLISPVGMILWSSRGYMVLGANQTLLHNALHHALRKLNLPYEESAQTYLLSTINDKLAAEARPIDGVFLLRLKKSENRRTLQRLAGEVNDFFRTTPVRTNRRGGYVYVLIGAWILLIGSCLTLYRLSLRAEIQALEKAHPEFSMSPEK